jgi:predicted AlkP superfamily phosphohydrolase/phosphomutase
MTVFVASDRIQHAAGEAIDTVGDPQRSLLADCIEEVYGHIDQEIAQLLRLLDESWTVVIVSDHGAAPYRRVFNLVYWLVENGFLKLLEHRARGTLVYGMQRLKHKVQFALGSESRQGSKRISPLLPIVDWGRTKAYAFGAFGSIFINLRSREPLGTVERGREYEDLLTEISERLLRATDPATGDRLVDEVCRAEDVYSGGCLSLAPDLLVTPTKDYHVRNSLDDFHWDLTYAAGKYGRRSTLHTGKHSRDGVLIAQGPALKKGYAVKNAQIVDVAPTILYLLGEPKPQVMDGRVLQGAIRAEYLADNPIAFDDRDDHECRTPSQNVYDEGEKRDIEDRLRGLGYLG